MNIEWFNWKLKFLQIIEYKWIPFLVFCRKHLQSKHLIIRQYRSQRLDTKYRYHNGTCGTDLNQHSDWKCPRSKQSEKCASKNCNQLRENQHAETSIQRVHSARQCLNNAEENIEMRP